MKRSAFNMWTGAAGTPGSARAALGGAVVAAAAAWMLGACGQARAGPAPAADLVITEIVPLPDANPAVSGTISVEVTILNQGDLDVTDPFDVDLYRNSGFRPKATDTPDDTGAATVPLGAGQTTKVTFAGITNGTAEEWKMWAFVDRVDGIAESGENNNVNGPVVVTWGGGATKPDLQITAITPADPAPTPGTPISVLVKVMNAGNADANSFRLDLFTNPAVPPVVGDQATVPAPQTGLSLAIGAEQDFAFTGVVSATDATWQMYAVVDTIAAVDELKEHNNVYGPEPLVWGTAASLALDSPNGSEVWEVGTIQNITWTSIGDVGSSVMLEYSTDGGASVWQVITPSTLNDSQYEWTVPDDPSTDCVVRVSSTSAAYEDASDDIFTIQASVVSKPDLKILSMTPSEANPVVGNSIDVFVTVLNQGDADAGFFTVDLFKDRGVPPVVGESEGLIQSVTSLGAGFSTQVTFSGLTSGTVATWDMYAIADTGGFIDESNETNNVFGSVLVGWGGGVEAITVISPNGAEVLEAGVPYDITWTTQGGLAPPFHIEYSTDSGTSWTEVVGLTFNSGSFTWTVPAVASTDCRVLVSNPTGTVSDISDAAFEINTTSELVILAVVPSDAHPMVGEVISVAVVVGNQGTAAAGPFVVALFMNTASAPAVGSLPDASQAVASLAAGGQTTVIFDLIVSGASAPWDMYAIVDNGAAVAEKNEANNVSGLTPVEWHPQPWLGTGCSGTARGGGRRGPAVTWALSVLAAAFVLGRRRLAMRDRG